MATAHRLTPAQWADLMDERCQYVSRGKHSLALNTDNGEITCDNRGCGLSALHPDYRSGSPRKPVARPRQTPRASRPARRPPPRRSAAPSRLSPFAALGFLGTAGAVTYGVGVVKGWWAG